MKKVHLRRRSFLKAAAATLSIPCVWSSPRTRGQDVNSQITIAAIGVGGSGGGFGRGGKVGLKAAELGRMITICDVDEKHAGEYVQKFDHKITAYKDYRELLEKEKPDVAVIGTPDHWHTAIAIAAMKAGADVYCEKPLTLTIDEGKLIRKVAEETGCVFQVGSQQRSENDERFLKAVALARSGRLGRKLTAYVGIGGGPSGGPFTPTDPPAQLDWDMWLGQAPKVPYTKERCHGSFRWWLEYSGGKMTDWGAHHIDIAQWALGFQNSGPVEVAGTGEFPPHVPEGYDAAEFFAGKLALPNGYNTATKFDINLTYADGNVVNVQPSARGDGGNGILIEGNEGRIFVNRGRLTGKPIEDLTAADEKWLGDEVVKLYKGKEPGDHMRNFFECIRDRSRPISDVWTHHRTMTSCHLCNITLLLGRKLRWDPETEHFPGDPQADALLSRPQRKGYEIGA